MTLPCADSIDKLLPQTQCRQCGYDGCAPYARAISLGNAPVNRCPPGGQAGVERLARLTGLPALPLDPQCGHERPRTQAWIDPLLCIGCTKCILACPVDAIIGASRRLHAVAPALCTGCELCVAPCPVDCIRMLPADGAWTTMMADAARARFQRRGQRQARDARLLAQRLARKALAPAEAVQVAGAPGAGNASTGAATASMAATAAATPPVSEALRKRLMIDAAVARARQRLEAAAQTAVAARKDPP